MNIHLETDWLEEVTDDGEPVGITFTASAYSEPILIEIGYSYEQATKHRKPPVLKG